MRRARWPPISDPPISSSSIRMNIASWCFLEERFAPVRDGGTAMKSASALFSQWASGIQSRTVKRRERSSRKYSKRCKLEEHFDATRALRMLDEAEKWLNDTGAVGGHTAPGRLHRLHRILM